MAHFGGGNDDFGKYIHSISFVENNKKTNTIMDK